MKSFIVLPLIVLISSSCNNNTTTNNNTETDSSAGKPATSKTECYFYTNNKDSVTLRFTVSDHSVSGDLEYKFSGKDMNQGVIQGEMRGDTLLADYEFKSEGIVSVREVAFLKKGDAYAEGYGEAEDKDGKMVFKNVAGLTYSDTVVLKKINCPQ
ncbi:MAG: hypothetical protein QM764_02510 [Chitinophagaceae bacterium]